MQITKLGHCCLLVEVEGVRVLTDPGVWSEGVHEVKGVDAILITHEHADHLHIKSLQEVLRRNPTARLITNFGVGKMLSREGIAFETIKNSRVRSLAIEAIETMHAPIYPDVPPVPNTGFYIGQRLFVPGDALDIPPRAIEVLAIPIIGPWLTIAHALDFALAIKPKVAFPIHDGMLKECDWLYAHPTRVLPPAGIEFVPLQTGDTHSFE